MKIDTRLLQLLWNDISDMSAVQHFGSGTDRFIAPNKVVREGVFPIEGNKEFSGLEHSAVITKLVPRNWTETEGDSNASCTHR